MENQKRMGNAKIAKMFLVHHQVDQCMLYGSPKGEKRRQRPYLNNIPKCFQYEESIQLQEAQRSPTSMKLKKKKPTRRQIIIKLLKGKDRILKTREKKFFI
jgi:hypothetical protein